MQFGSPCQ
jgi:hypothetical protein